MSENTSTRTQYEFIDIRRGGGSGTPCARFRVEDSSGQTHEELLNFTVLEARMQMWDELLARDPALVMRDPRGFANYRQYVRAVVEGLRQHAL